ncbi:Hypothetical Protein FCC1311_048592 [Hondaea fermentalgiana]|uniref:Uncharacterized protein n=1 Tax=Hondaea fermentalgiana TaxID=2315210 RepID=A0A2R5GFV1_9STRA|nr:Hypothetical Protein FCC1311_048592 [Hondaea fermentalgiana]|eukprot:GBG28638.1 Hypothetical Protein FCC1311_048592 [Hondaea fermentalgiana]
MVRLRVRFVVVAVRPADGSSGEDAAESSGSGPGRPAKRRRGGEISALESEAAAACATASPAGDEEGDSSAPRRRGGKRQREAEIERWTDEEWLERRPMPCLASATGASVSSALTRKIREDFGDFGAATLGISLKGT